jgi:hypothetical protein
VFQFHRGPQPDLPDGVLFYAALDYWDRHAAGLETLSLRDLARRPGSPGQLFKLDENSLAERCGQVEDWTDGAVGYHETAGLKQLYRRRHVDPFVLLQQVYATPSTGGGQPCLA